ncbi:hypothetical protein [Piscinibacter sp.]|uniref:hypothetical protein n=1 Tax=Piscinibacter sp. TaxID=1903157 RepID=UPI001DEDE2A4|nr:hypothetical protein [Piscinibacter sp.]MBK7531006.1 hypothetical protein [Piscinibacter sp.]
MDHALDVAGFVAFAIKAKTALGLPTAAAQQRLADMKATAAVAFAESTRTTLYLPKYRVNPPAQVQLVDPRPVRARRQRRRLSPLFSRPTRAASSPTGRLAQIASPARSSLSGASGTQQDPTIGAPM